jgi:hypothetical protein
VKRLVAGDVALDELEGVVELDAVEDIPGFVTKVTIGLAVDRYGPHRRSPEA